jgi:hypothetical protein
MLFSHMPIVLIWVARVKRRHRLSLGFQGLGALVSQILLKHSRITCVGSENRIRQITKSIEVVNICIQQELGEELTAALSR